MRLLFAFLTALLISTAAARAETPAPLALRLDLIGEYSRARDGYSLIVMQGDKLLLEEYENGSTADTPQRIASIVKNFWGLTALALVDDGLLDLDRPICSILKEWANDPGKRRITVRQ